MDRQSARWARGQLAVDDKTARRAQRGVAAYRAWARRGQQGKNEGEITKRPREKGGGNKCSSGRLTANHPLTNPLTNAPNYIVGKCYAIRLRKCHRSSPQPTPEYVPWPQIWRVPIGNLRN